MFAKSDVNGKNENPIYTFLKSRCPSVRMTSDGILRSFSSMKEDNQSGDTTSPWIPWRLSRILMLCSAQSKKKSSRNNFYCGNY